MKPFLAAKAATCSSGFVIAMDQDLPFPATGLAAQICRFDPALFEDRHFEEYGVPFAPSLARASPHRRADYLAGRICARAALARIGVERVPPIAAPGQPPAWPAGTVGSISHCGGIAVAVAGPSRLLAGVGVDCERVVAGETAGRISALVLAPDEEPDAPTLDRSQIVTLALSAKESFYKAVGRIWPHISLRDARLERATDGVFALRLVGGARTGETITGRYAFEDGFVLTLATLERTP